MGQTDKPLSNEEQDSIKNLTPIPGKAIVYIIRPTTYGFAVPMRLDCVPGWLSQCKLFYTILDSGEHEFKLLLKMRYT
jgi:hypothetical protein